MAQWIPSWSRQKLPQAAFSPTADIPVTFLRVVSAFIYVVCYV